MSKLTEKQIAIKWVEFVQKFAHDVNRYDLDILFEEPEDIRTYAIQALNVLNSCGLDAVEKSL